MVLARYGSIPWRNVGDTTILHTSTRTLRVSSRDGHILCRSFVLCRIAVDIHVDSGTFSHRNIHHNSDSAHHSIVYNHLGI